MEALPFLAYGLPSVLAPKRTFPSLFESEPKANINCDFVSQVATSVGHVDNTGIQSVIKYVQHTPSGVALGLSAPS